MPNKFWYLFWGKFQLGIPELNNIFPSIGTYLKDIPGKFQPLRNSSCRLHRVNITTWKYWGHNRSEIKKYKITGQLPPQVFALARR